MPLAGLTRRFKFADAAKAASVVRPFCEPLPPIVDPEAFGAMFDRFADAKVVLLGEATHGTSEFYRARAAITRRLVERHGFTIVAVEADWPDATRIDAFVRHHRPKPTKEEAFARFPTWMWRNVEVNELITWMRARNEGLPKERRTEFRGLDVYSLNASIKAVLGYLDHIDPEAARHARGRYGCLSPWQADPARYGRAVLTGEKKPPAAMRPRGAAAVSTTSWPPFARKAGAWCGPRSRPSRSSASGRRSRRRGSWRQTRDRARRPHPRRPRAPTCRPANPAIRRSAPRLPRSEPAPPLRTDTLRTDAGSEAYRQGDEGPRVLAVAHAAQGPRRLSCGVGGRQATQICSMCRWSVPQQPPSTLSCGSRRRSPA